MYRFTCLNKTWEKQSSKAPLLQLDPYGESTVVIDSKYRLARFPVSFLATLYEGVKGTISFQMMFHRCLHIYPCGCKEALGKCLSVFLICKSPSFTDQSSCKATYTIRLTTQESCAPFKPLIHELKGEGNDWLIRAVTATEQHATST